MREIKFRGKRLDNGEWVYGSLLMSEPQEKAQSHYTVLFFPDKVSQGYSETVGHHTGLKDKNGVRFL